MTTSVHIACYCGLNSFTIPVATSSLPLVSRVCHCSSCRSASGSLTPISVHLPSATADSFPLGTTIRAAVDAEGKETTRWFCVTCGSHMLMSVDTPAADGDPSGAGGMTWTALAGVVQGWEDLVEIRSHIYVGDTVDGGGATLLTNIDGRQIPLWTQGEGSTPFVAPAPSLSGPSSPSSSPVLVQCLCTDFSLNLARPSSTSTHLPSPTSSTPSSPPASPSSPISDNSDPAAPTVPWHIQELSAHPDKLYHASLCVCASCAQTSGSPIFPWAYVPLDRLSLAASPSSTPLTPDTLRAIPALQSYKSSKNVERFFCRTCGATAFYTHAGRPHLVDLAVGLIRCEDGARVEGWMEWRKTLSMVGYAPGGEVGKVLRAFEEGMKRVGTADR